MSTTVNVEVTIHGFQVVLGRDDNDRVTRVTRYPTRSAPATTWTCGGALERLATIGSRSYLVTRRCYLALRRAVAVTPRATGLAVLSEPGRAMPGRDIETALGVPAAAEPAIDHAGTPVDAGPPASPAARTASPG